MELADILPEESVLFCTDIKTKRDVLERLSSQVAKRTGHTAEEIFEALNDRESLGSTGLGNGIAVPHGKFAGLKGVIAVFMKLSVPESSKVANSKTPTFVVAAPFVQFPSR